MAREVNLIPSLCFAKRAGIPALFFIFITAIFLYVTSLDGPFVLDDISNFNNLHFIHSPADHLNYIIHGDAGARYFSYATFSLQYKDFIANNARPFKTVNLILHITNCILVFSFTLQLLRLKKIADYQIISGAIAIIWFIHPIQTYTVLYSVQRMNILASMFILSGLIIHLTFLERKLVTNTATTFSWRTYHCIIWTIAALAIISKENGILLMAFIMLVNHYMAVTPFNAWQRNCTYVLPFCCLAMFLIFTHQLQFGGRNFSLPERLLSETVILKEYFLKILIPDQHSFALFHDDFKPVKELADSRWFLAIIFWFCVFLITRALEKFCAGITFGIVWFFIGHALESTVIPLELYFDHRNYLPAYGLIFSITLLLVTAIKKISHTYIKVLLTILSITLTINLLMILNQETFAWQNEYTLAKDQFFKKPNSLRAYQYLADTQFNKGELQASRETINAMHQRFGKKSSSTIQQLVITCLLNRNIQVNTAAFINNIQPLPPDNAITDAMHTLFHITRQKYCPSINWDFYRQLTDVLLSTNKQTKMTYSLTYLLVLSYSQNGMEREALAASLDLAENIREPSFIFLQLDLAIKNNEHTLAKKLYNDIRHFDHSQKLIYKNELDQIDSYMRNY